MWIGFHCIIKAEGTRARGHSALNQDSAVTKKTHEAAGFFLGFPVALVVITGSSAEPKWVKTRKTRGFLGYWDSAEYSFSLLYCVSRTAHVLSLDSFLGEFTCKKMRGFPLLRSVHGRNR